jgi:hypothetical protein
MEGLVEIVHLGLPRGKMVREYGQVTRLVSMWARRANV